MQPHDLDDVKDSMVEALNQPKEDGRRHMRALRRQVLTHDVDRWARSFLDALAHGGAAGPALIAPGENHEIDDNNNN